MAQARSLLAVLDARLAVSKPPRTGTDSRELDVCGRWPDWMTGEMFDDLDARLWVFAKGASQGVSADNDDDNSEMYRCWRALSKLVARGKLTREAYRAFMDVAHWWEWRRGVELAGWTMAIRRWEERLAFAREMRADNQNIAARVRDRTIVAAVNAFVTTPDYQGEDPRNRGDRAVAKVLLNRHHIPGLEKEETARQIIGRLRRERRFRAYGRSDYRTVVRRRPSRPDYSDDDSSDL